MTRVADHVGGARDVGSIYSMALYRRSRIDLKEGRHDDAIHRLQQAADAIERVRGSIPFEAGKLGFAGNTQEVYASLVHAFAEQGNWAGVFIAALRQAMLSLVDGEEERQFALGSFAVVGEGAPGR